MTQGSDSIRSCHNKKIKPPCHASLIDTWQGGFGLWRIMWRLRRRAAGRCTGPYAGAAVGAMYGPCRRRVSGDAAVAWVVVCTVARPLVPHGCGAGCVSVQLDLRVAVSFQFVVAAELWRMIVSWPWLRLHGVGIVAACSRGCNLLGGKALVHVLMHGLAARSRQTHRRRDCCNSGPLLKGNPPCTVSGTWGTVVLGYGF